MKAEDHIIAWIESSRPHYDRLLTIEIDRKALGFLTAHTSCMIIRRATDLVSDAYHDMIRCGDARRDDPYSPADLVKAVALAVAWELEQ